MAEFYTYLYSDPKDSTPVYVGKGKNKRAFSHLKHSTNRRLRHLIAKRQSEGYTVVPAITPCSTEVEALALEIELIARYGRSDLGKGTLFNLTDGGEGPSGAKRGPSPLKGKPSPLRGTSGSVKWTDEQRAAQSARMKGKPAPNRGSTWTDEQKAAHAQRMKGVSKRGSGGTPWSEEQRRKFRATVAQRRSNGEQQ